VATPEHPARQGRLSPEAALRQGRWVKLICGAGNQDLAAIEDLCALYAQAGVHCIDIAADAAVAAAARRGMDWAEGQGARRPWLMLSLSDGDDPHFRKAQFDPNLCPQDCPRPCQRVCPAEAITGNAGVLAERCYGCGRCLPACPLGLIQEEQHLLPAEEVPALLQEIRPDAVELHTQAGRQEAFRARLGQLEASGIPLQRLAISCGLERGAGAKAQSRAALSARELAAELWQRFAEVRRAGFLPLWQLDGRPMSGDVGAGTARAAVKLLEELRPWAPPGPLQLAGGTNAQTLPLLPPGSGAAGVAFGGMARSLLQPLLQEAEAAGVALRESPALRPQAQERIQALIAPWLTR
jgi:Fe-S-cluster-containing hydrogenase component 2